MKWILLSIAVATACHAKEPTTEETGSHSVPRYVGIQGLVLSAERKVQRIHLPGGSVVSLDVAQVRITYPVELLGGVMNITYLEQDRLFWESTVQKEVSFEMAGEEFHHLTEVLGDDRRINSFPAFLLKDVKVTPKIESEEEPNQPVSQQRGADAPHCG